MRVWKYWSLEHAEEMKLIIISVLKMIILFLIAKESLLLDMLKHVPPLKADKDYGSARNTLFLIMTLYLGTLG